MAGTILVAVHGLNFSVGPTAQCDPLSVSWSGGQPPFQLLLIPPGGTITNISIPATAFDDVSKQGSYTVPQLSLTEGTQFMLSMSDGTGVFAGGTSSLKTVGASQSNQACNITDLGTDFFFSLDSPLTQCGPYPFTHFNGAVLPITILVHIPQGQSILIHPPQADSFTWVANLTAGTPAAFSIYDSEGRSGGTSSIRVVQLTNDTSCLSFSTSTTSGKEPESSNSNPSGSYVATAKGLAVGISIGVLGLLGFSFLICFGCYRRSRLHRRQSRITSSYVDLIYDPGSTRTSLPNNRRQPPSFVMSDASASTLAEVNSVRQISGAVSYSSSRVPSLGHPSLYQPDPFLAPSPQNGSQPRSSKWSIQNQDTTSALTYPSDVIVHVDAADSAIGLMELPPRYSADRVPLPGLPHTPIQIRTRDSV